MLEIISCEQGTPEWFAARCGLPTASMFSAILAKGEGKTRKTYLNRLAGEVITGEAAETFQSQAMERGKVMEAEARDLYEFISEEPLEAVGFIRNGRMGCSPDRLVGANGGLEIKTQKAELLVDTILAGRFPSEHKAQVQGNLLVTGREWWDLIVYWPKMPLFRIRAERDEEYISNLAAEIARFNEDLDATVASLRSYGKAA